MHRISVGSYTLFESTTVHTAQVTGRVDIGMSGDPGA